MRYIITIDQRTSSSKVLLFNENLDLVDHSDIPFKVTHSKTDWTEADADEIYEATLEAVRQLDLPKGDDVTFSVSLVNQRETFRYLGQEYQNPGL